MMPVGDIAWDTGNESFYQHSIGIEQEGFAIDGHTWYTGAMYQATAKLVKYLAKRFGIPLDRAHILGHDNIPGGSEHAIRFAEARHGARSQGISHLRGNGTSMV